MCWHTLTYLRTRQIALTNLLNRAGYALAGPPNQISASRNGTWIHFEFQDRKNGGRAICSVVHLESGRHREWSCESELTSFWSDDHTLASVREIQAIGDGQDFIVPAVSLYDARGHSADRHLQPNSPEIATILGPYSRTNPIKQSFDSINGRVDNPRPASRGTAYICGSISAPALFRPTR